MSEIEDKNRNERIQQQKGRFVRNIIICISLLLVFSLVFWLVSNNAAGTEIDDATFQTQLENQNIKEIYLNNSKIQIVYVSGENHWIYAEYSRDQILSYINELKADKKAGLYEGRIPNIKYGKPTTFTIMDILYPLLMISTVVILLVLMLKRVKGENNKSFDFVKSRARITPSKTKFSDVAGEDEEKAELEDVVDFLKNPKKYIDLGAKIPKGVLLVGPPGTGKTLLARAVAGEAGVPFFTISGSDFMELFVGVGASRVRDLFENAKKAKPCIIFIDEIDAVGRQRGAGLGGGNDEREQTLNQLLVQMDGFEDNEGIIVMAATNRVDILDPALLRPGRFDRRVNISVPDVKGREAILKVHSRNKPLEKNVDLKTIARITAGFTGAEIENLLNEAAILTAKENRTEITTEDIQKSMMKVTLGPQKKSRVIDEQDKKNTAIHESGHAIVNRLAKVKSPVQEVSIIPRGGAGGYTLSADDDKVFYYRERLLCRIQVLLGGIVAEKLFVGDVSTGASSDLKRATEIARRMVTEWGMSSEIGMVYCGNDDAVFIGKNYQERMSYSENQAALIDSEVKKIIEMCQKETEKILKTHKDKLLTMADVLIEKETIYAEEVDLIVKGKSKEEVLQHIDNKDKKETTSETENKEKIAENNDKTVKSVDDLLKEAENREKSLAEETKTQEVKPLQAEEVSETKTETQEESKVQEEVSANAEKPKSTRKPATKKAGETKTTAKTKAVKTKETKPENNDKIEE